MGFKDLRVTEVQDVVFYFRDNLPSSLMIRGSLLGHPVNMDPPSLVLDHRRGCHGRGAFCGAWGALNSKP